MKYRKRRGFTLVELLVVIVLATFMVLTIYQVLIANSRTYAVNNAQIQGQQMLRAGMDVLFGELREISTPGGDLLDMKDHHLVIRAQRAFGLVCTADYSVSPPKLTLFRVGPAFQPNDSIFLFLDNNPNLGSDDRWVGGITTAVDSTTLCNGNPGQTLTVPFVGTLAAAASPDSVRVGAPARAFDVYTYGLFEIDGEPYLGRQLKGAAAPDPLVGPLLATNGVTFRYLDSLGAVTTADTLVSQIEVILRYRSKVRTFGNALVADSILARVYPRN